MPSTFGYNDKYLLRNGKPWFPVMGEFHYSRFDRRFWKEAVMKMKAGGVDIISSYVIWIHHEEIEGEYDFTGNRDLNEFLGICKECGVYVWLRIGPWCHGEVRNGGFPDWLMKKPFSLRENNDGYLNEVKKFYTRVYKEAKDFLHINGGPIIGIQIENEYGHCGGLNGEEGEKHMETLLAMAKEIGFEVAIYTATGWGGAVTGGMLPVMGGYCEAPWDQRLTEIEPSGNYTFTYERNDHNIGSDLGIGTGITFDASKFPYLTAELGGGLQVTKHRRPVSTAEDIAAMSLVKLGSGVNLLGYYMYHGGTNPEGKLTTLQESRETGYLNDLPEFSYDFNAPIKEFGQTSETFKELRLLTMFLHDFGEELCEMPAYIPESNPLKPTDIENLRTSVRHNGESGYLFVNNYLRRRKMRDHKNIYLKADINGKEYVFPETDVNDGDFFFCPINMKIGKGKIKTSLASPLCKLDDRIYFFYGREDIITEGDVSDCEIRVIPKELAKNACKIKLDREYLAVTEGLITGENGNLTVYSDETAEVGFYPNVPAAPEGFKYTGVKNGLYYYERAVGEKKPECGFSLVKTNNNGSKLFDITVKIPKSADNCFLSLSWAGSIGYLFINGKKKGDVFYTGQTWDIGLRGFDFPETLSIEIMPLKKDEEVFLEKWPEMIEGSACSLKDVSVRAVYKTELNIKCK